MGVSFSFPPRCSQESNFYSQAPLQAPFPTEPSHQHPCLGTEMIVWGQSNFVADLWVHNWIHFLPAPSLSDHRSSTMSPCSLPPVTKCLKGKSENKQMKNVALLHMNTLAVFVLFCLSGRNNWQLKSSLSTQSENVLCVPQAFVMASLEWSLFSSGWKDGQDALKETQRGLSADAES